MVAKHHFCTRKRPLVPDFSFLYDHWPSSLTRRRYRLSLGPFARSVGRSAGWKLRVSARLGAALEFRFSEQRLIGNRRVFVLFEDPIIEVHGTRNVAAEASVAGGVHE